MMNYIQMMNSIFLLLSFSLSLSVSPFRSWILFIRRISNEFKWSGAAFGTVYVNLLLFAILIGRWPKDKGECFWCRAHEFAAVEFNGNSMRVLIYRNNKFIIIHEYEANAISLHLWHTMYFLIRKWMHPHINLII